MMRNNKTAMAVRKIGIVMFLGGGAMILGSAAMDSMMKCKSPKTSDKIMKAIDDVVSGIQNIMK